VPAEPTILAFLPETVLVRDINAGAHFRLNWVEEMMYGMMT
jgi:hypothetical protein